MLQMPTLKYVLKLKIKLPTELIPVFIIPDLKRNTEKLQQNKRVSSMCKTIVCKMTSLLPVKKKLLSVGMRHLYLS